MAWICMALWSWTSPRSLCLSRLLSSLEPPPPPEPPPELPRAATLSISKLNNQDNIARAFSYFDKDGSGYITVDELTSVMKDFQLSNGMSVEDFLAEVDTDNDGKVDYDEFLAMMTSKDDANGGAKSVRRELHASGYA